MNAMQLFHQDGKPSKAWYCPECKLVKANQKDAERCCQPVICDCGKEVEEKYWTACNACRKLKDEAREKARFDAAEKVTDWDGPVYSDGLGYNDGYFSELDALYEDIEPEDLPNYVWCCDSDPTVSLSIGSFLDNIEFPENQDEHDLDGLKELQEALDIFNDKNKNVTTWTPDYKRVYVIRSEEK
jgi:hypothetical protein